MSAEVYTELHSVKQNSSSGTEDKPIYETVVANYTRVTPKFPWLSVAHILSDDTTQSLVCEWLYTRALMVTTEVGL